jgi:hypothetical protein
MECCQHLGRCTSGPLEAVEVSNVLVCVIGWNVIAAYQDMHLWQHVVRRDKVVSDPYPVRFHWVAKAVCIRTYIGFFEEYQHPES